MEVLGWACLCQGGWGLLKGNGAVNSATAFIAVSDPFSVPVLTVFRSVLEFSP